MTTQTLVFIFKLVALLNLNAPVWLQEYCEDQMVSESFIIQHCNIESGECFGGEIKLSREKKEEMKETLEQAEVCRHFLDF